MTPFTIYLWQQVDSIIHCLDMFALPVSAIGFAGLLITTIALAVEGDDESVQKRFAPARNASLATLLLSAFLSFTASIIPSSKTIAMMVAIPAIANSEPIQKDLPELYQLAKDALKEQITGKKDK